MSEQHGGRPARLLAIGDVHGHLARLEDLLAQVRPTTADELVLLGDYIDRGEDPVGCLRRVRRLRAELGAVCLRGNHEQMMLDCVRRGEDVWLHPGNGGLATWTQLRALDPAERADLLAFVDGLPLMHRRTVDGREHVFVHAGVEPGVDLDQQDPDALLWIRGEFLGGFRGDGRRYVVGHTPVQAVTPDKAEPLDLPNGVLMLDTGSFLPNGRITCVDLLSGRTWWA